MTNENDRIHGQLGRESAGDAGPADDRMERYRAVLERLAASRVQAPDGLEDRILGALPDRPRAGWRRRVRAWWPGRGRWLAPAIAGAAAVLAVVAVVGPGRLAPGPASAPRPVASAGDEPLDRVAVRFEVAAPGARRVELVGSFNDWRPGEIVLDGPDAAGRWTATVELPAGRHEYLFLVDGKQWVTDPRAAAYRPDGFGRENALLEL